MSWTCGRCQQPRENEVRPVFVTVPHTRGRIGICPRCAACKHPRQVTPEGRYTEWRCLDCNVTGRVIRGVA